MVAAFLYLTACSLKNGMRRRAQRLREPRYLIGLLVGGAYLYLMLFRRSVRSSSGRGMPTGMLAQAAGPMQFVGSLLLLGTAAFAWVLPGVGRPITFSRAEVQFLFTAPVTRRQLLHYKLLRSQIGILLTSAIMTLFLRPATLGGGWMFLAGLWLLLVTVRLHLMGVALSRSSLAGHGRSAVGRQWPPLVVVAGALAVLTYAVVRDWSALVSLSGVEAIFTELQRLGTTGAAGIVLWPFRALARLPLAASPAEFAAALPPVLILLALNYVWVLRADAAFEEASAAHAERQATIPRGSRPVARGPVSTPFQLAEHGPPETAILWKNLISLGRYVSLRTLLRLLPLAIAIAIAARSPSAGGLARLLASVCLMGAAMLTLIGSQMVRNDLRQDLANLAALKTWPIRGAALIRGEILAPTAVLTVLVWLMLVVGLLPGNAVPSPLASGPVQRWSYGTAAAVLAPALILAQVVVQNAIAVLFPAWAAIGSSRARGIDAMGQRLLMMAALLLVLVVAFLPGAAVAAAVAFVFYWLTGTVVIVLPAIIVSLVVIAECWLAVEGLGRVLDRTDATAIEGTE